MKNIKRLLLMAILLILPTISGCKKEALMTNQPQTYRVQRLTAPPTIDADWNKPQWQGIPAATLTLFMGKKPAHIPQTEFKVAYDANNLYVIFRVQDQYIKAIRQGYHSPVCRDSCVEFFFTPGTDIAQGYFNIETNCGGTILFNHQRSRGISAVNLDSNDLNTIAIAHSLPKIVDPEIQLPTTWTLEYHLPISILERYAPIVKPQPGAVWKANFYKCADESSRPHWLTWSIVDKPQPDFHRPEFFGTLIFE